MGNGQLYFEFKEASGEVVPRLFEEPIEVITTERLEEVVDCMRRVEEASKAGYYVAGYVSYEAAPAFDRALRVKNGATMPLVWFGVYKESGDASTFSAEAHFDVRLHSHDTTREQYDEAIQAVRNAIKEGITYQANYTIRLNGEIEGCTKSFFKQLQRNQQANYTAYLHIGSHEILSASPELFFSLKDGRVTTKPMKGTSRRGRYHAEDIAFAEELYASTKNRAENVMIVDLLRNDLGRVAKTNTVKVEKLFEIEQYPTVHQMTSTVSAQLREEVGLVELFQSLFPCGSITGAPKISTMQVIEEIERSPRDVYCGAIGYLKPGGEAVFNVPIRTAVVRDGELTYGVGGGITWDSSAASEFAEVLAKAQVLLKREKPFQLLESLLVDNGELFLLDEHIARLRESARYFGWSVNEEIVRALLEEHAALLMDGLYKVRLLVSKNGEMTVESTEISELRDVIQVSLAKGPVDSGNVYLFHKTTNRDMYAEHQPKEGCFDVLLYNERGEVTEFRNGNVVFERDGQWFTPPVHCGLLAGTYRASLLAAGELVEKVVRVDEMESYDAVYFINSVRKMKKVTFI